MLWRGHALGLYTCQSVLYGLRVPDLFTARSLNTGTGQGVCDLLICRVVSAHGLGNLGDVLGMVICDTTIGKGRVSGTATVPTKGLSLGLY